MTVTSKILCMLITGNKIPKHCIFRTLLLSVLYILNYSFMKLEYVLRYLFFFYPLYIVMFNKANLKLYILKDFYVKIGSSKKSS